MGKRYKPEQIEYVRENAHGRYIEDLVAMFNERFETQCTWGQIRCLMHNHKIKSGMAGYPKNVHRLLTEEQVEFMRKNAPGRTRPELADLMNRAFGLTLTATQVDNAMARFKINSGIDGKFQKGCLPNQWCIKKGQHVSPETEFKKGQKPINTHPIGTVLTKSDGFIYKKFAETTPSRFGWKQLHRLIYEEAYGPIPDHCTVIFLDGNRESMDLTNLIMISRGKHATMNHLHLRFSDPELTKTGLLIAELASANYRKNLAAHPHVPRVKKEEERADYGSKQNLPRRHADGSENIPR